MNKAVLLKRLNREIKSVKDENHFVEITDSNEQVITYKLKIFGPKDSPFENGVYYIEVKIYLSEYPYQPPKINFISKIFHPNISDENICIDILDDQWSAAMSLLSIMKSLENLLINPNPDSPMDSKAADSLINDESNYFRRNQELILENKARDSIHEQQPQEANSQDL